MTKQGSTSKGAITLLGPQRGFAEVAGVLDEYGITGRIGIITAGWQENESEDEGLVRELGRPCVNLALHARGERLASDDPEFVAATAERQKRLQHMQEFYRIRLDAIDDAGRAIAVRHVDFSLLDEQITLTIEQMRHLDAEHVATCRVVRDEFDAQWRPASRPAIARQRDEVAALVEQCEAVVIAGGHVTSLLNRMRLFGVLEMRGSRPTVAWSAGAMALTERIVLFHDFPPFGKNLAQMLDEGAGLCRGIVAMPDASNRVYLGERAGIGRFARRMAPARCMLLDPGSRIDFVNGEMVAARADRLMVDGEIEKGVRP
jgi:hypothetical protein